MSETKSPKLSNIEVISVSATTGAAYVRLDGRLYKADVVGRVLEADASDTQLPDRQEQGLEPASERFNDEAAFFEYLDGAYLKDKKLTYYRIVVAQRLAPSTLERILRFLDSERLERIVLTSQEYASIFDRIDPQIIMEVASLASALKLRRVNTFIELHLQPLGVSISRPRWGKEFENRAAGLHQVFDPSPLSSWSELDQLYVELDSGRGKNRSMETAARSIALSSRPSRVVLAGHRGSGKSTELFHLSKELTSRYHYRVINCPVDTLLDLDNVDFPDILLAILAGTISQCGVMEVVESSQLQRLVKKLSLALGIEERVTDAVGVKDCLMRLLSVMRNTDARAVLRTSVSRELEDWLDAANTLFGDVTTRLCREGRAGLVVMVDGLDKVNARRMHPVFGVPIGQHLFVDCAPQLVALSSHMVFTMPVHMLYLASFQFDDHLRPTVVPTVMVTTRPPERGEYRPGMEALANLVTRRLRAVGVGVEDVFDPGVLEDLLVKSGGQPREIVVMIQNAVARTEGRINKSILDAVSAERKENLVRSLTSEHWQIIRKAKSTRRIDRRRSNEVYFRELLDSRSILEYRDQEPWHDLNPLLQ